MKVAHYSGSAKPTSLVQQRPNGNHHHCYMHLILNRPASIVGGWLNSGQSNPLCCPQHYGELVLAF